MPCVYDARGVMIYKNDRLRECAIWWTREGEPDDWMGEWDLPDGVESIEELAHEMGLT